MIHVPQTPLFRHCSTVSMVRDETPLPLVHLANRTCAWNETATLSPHRVGHHVGHCRRECKCGLTLDQLLPFLCCLRYDLGNPHHFGELSCRNCSLQILMSTLHPLLHLFVAVWDEVFSTTRALRIWALNVLAGTPQRFDLGLQLRHQSSQLIHL